MGRKRKAASVTADVLEDLSEADDSAQPMLRNSANERERCRMRVLSRAFSHLKMTLPWVPSDTKLSKLDTLRLASCYIAHLRGILDAEDGNEPPPPLDVMRGRVGQKVDGRPAAGQTVHPKSLTWPFTFNGKIVTAETSSSADKTPAHRPPTTEVTTSS